jgi:TonB-linked SusC/RagA family outer membrane protein
MHSDYDVKDDVCLYRHAVHRFKSPSLKFLFTVKLTLLLLITFCLRVSATAYSQQINVSVRNEPFEKVIQTISKQAGYAFLSNARFIKTAKPVTLQLKNASLEVALDKAFESQPFGYEISDKIISIKEAVKQKSKAAENSTPTSNQLLIDVHGTVRDSTGIALPGVSVSIKGKTSGTITNEQGKFSMSNLSDDAILKFSMIGFISQEISIGSKTEINIVLREDNLRLAEVSIVSTGYQDLPKERATGSFVQIDNKQINRRISTNLMDRLEGITSGLNFNRSSTGEPTISIRGQSTIYANSAPLIVLDGFPFDGNINAINPNDIESITILKDAAAASIWGVRAGNGVIVITSKSGSLQSKMNLEFTSNITVGGKPDPYYLPKLSSQGFIEVERNLFEKGFYRTYELNTTTRPSLSPVIETLILARDGKISQAESDARISSFSTVDNREDFNRYFLRNNINQQYNLNARGGNDKLRYFLSGGLDENKEVLVRNKYRRISLRSDNTITPYKGLELTAGLMLVTSNSSEHNTGMSVINQPPGSLRSLYPYAQLADPNGDALPVSNQFRETFLQESTEKGLLDWQYRPLDELNLANNLSSEFYTRFNTSLKYRITNNLNLDARYQLEASQQNRKVINDQSSYFTRNLINQYSSIDVNAQIIRPIPLGAIRDDTEGKMRSSTIRAQVTFDDSFSEGKHDITIIGGAELRQTSFDAYTSRIYGYDDNIITLKPVDYSSLYRLFHRNLTQRIPNGNKITATLNRYISYYSNTAYTFKDKYILSGSARLDASNFFGAKTNEKMVPLWSTGMSWNMHKEAFFDINWLQSLILRATYGVSGNIDKSVTSYTTTTRNIDAYTLLPNAAIINPPNPTLSWERIAMTNIGLDFIIGNNVLSGSLEWYKKNGKDLLGFQVLDPTSGLTGFKGNVASMSGNGLDLTIASRNIRLKNFEWNTRFLASYTTDKITKVNMGKISALALVQQTQVFNGNSLTIVPGLDNAVYGIYSYKSAGLDPVTGDPRGFLNGEPSTNYAAIRANTNANELVYHGSARPKIFGAFANDIKFKDLTLSANVTYKLGHKFRRSSVNYEGLFLYYQGHSDFDSRWQKGGDELRTTVPAMPGTINANRDNFYLYLENLVEDASHVRLQDIKFNYHMALTKKKYSVLKDADVFLYANNLGIIWRANKSGIDPDYVPMVNSVFLPQPKTISIGLKIKL